MADEVALANVIRVERLAAGQWRATIGPDSVRGLSVIEPTAGAALMVLACRCARLGWCYDDTWRDPTRAGTDATAGATAISLPRNPI